MSQPRSPAIEKAAAVVMAGGIGLRFWPKSRQDRPKQCLRLIGKRSLLEGTVERLESTFQPKDIFCIVIAEQEKLVRGLLPHLPPENIFLEPARRNTAACLCLASLAIEARRGDLPIFVTPADHLIQDEGAFQRVVHSACQAARERDYLITLGLEPTRPTAGYGYMERGELLFEEPEPFYRVKRFVEKPSRERASKFIRSGTFLWNSGMFFWRPSVILSSFEHHMPELLHPLRSLQDHFMNQSIDSVVKEVYPSLPATSIDYGIMEKASNVALLPAAFGWADLGDWEALAAALPSDEEGNHFDGEVVAFDTKDTYISSSEKLIAAIGLEHLIVVETADAILICPKERSQDVKPFVKKLAEAGAKRFL